MDDSILSQMLDGDYGGAMLDVITCVQLDCQRGQFEPQYLERKCQPVVSL